jgi:hypothetical protein
MYLGRITNGNSNIHEITRKINSEKAYYAYHNCYLPIAFPYQSTWKYTTNKQKNCQF